MKTTKDDRRDYNPPHKRFPLIPGVNIPLSEIYVKQDGTTPIQIPNTSPAGSQKIGDITGGNYLEILQDGTTILHGTATAWNDSMMPALSFRTGGTALTFVDCGNGIFLTRFDIGDIFYVQFQLPHNYIVGSAIYPHLHVMNNTAIGATGYNFEVTIAQSWASIGQVFPAPTVTSTGLVHSFQNAPKYRHDIQSLPTVTPSPTQGGISSFLMYKVERIAASVQPLNPAQSLFILGMDIHYEIDSFGSKTELSK